MAEVIVEVCKIEKVLPHPNADALELAQIKGWQCVVPIGKYEAGVLVTYIPIDAMIPLAHSDRWGITKYLSVRAGVEGPDPVPAAGRVRCARLRGEPSFGVIIDREEADWVEGQDVKEHYGIFKYIPPFRASAGDSAPPHPLFIPLLLDGKYADAETFFALCEQYGVETAPILYRGAYTLEKVRELSAGNTTLEGDHIREGVVVKPVVERVHPKVGRVALKYIGDAYLFSKSADRDTHDV